jgi:hypothetical protein
MAFGLPATPAAIALVMLAQGGGRLLPLAPASAAATVAVVAAGLPGATGVDVGARTAAALVVGMSTVLTIVGVALAVGIAVAMAGGRLPVRSFGGVTRTVFGRPGRQNWWPKWGRAS